MLLTLQTRGDGLITYPLPFARKSITPLVAVVVSLILDRFD
jgi:hypothetical protein